MKQFKTILAFELKNYFKNKIFVGVTVALVLVIAAIMFFPRISTLIKSEESSQEVTKNEIMLIVADSKEHQDLIQETFSNAFLNYDVQSASSLEEAKEKISSFEAQCAFVFNDLTSYTYYVENLSMMDSNTMIADEILKNIYHLDSMTQSGLSLEQAQQILSTPITHEIESLGKDQMMNFFYTYIMIFALYMVILLYGQMVATNVATEKSSRAMEVLITSAKPTAMMFGKVLASCLAGLIQLICVFGSALLFFNLNKSLWGENIIINSIFNMPLDLFIYMILFFILGFLIYAFMFGAIGSTASKLEDINTSVMPLTLLFVAGFLVVMLSMTSGTVDSLLMKICSFIPFTSPMAMFTRIAMSTVPFIEILISIIILIASVFGIGVLSAKIYRVGVLLYGTTPKIGSILKSIWKA